jgi:hypothetical protein
MEIKCTDKKTFELTDGAEKLGHISYDSLFTHSATAVVGDDHFEIDTAGIFNSTISVIHKAINVASLQMSWKGDIIIFFQNSGQFILKANGIFRSKYVLEDQNKQPLLLLTPDFNWRKFNYNYSITYDRKPENILLVLLAAYAANYYIATMSGVY